MTALVLVEVDVMVLEATNAATDARPTITASRKQHNLLSHKLAVACLLH